MLIITNKWISFFISPGAETNKIPSKKDYRRDGLTENVIILLSFLVLQNFLSLMNLYIIFLLYNNGLFMPFP